MPPRAGARLARAMRPRGAKVGALRSLRGRFPGLRAWARLFYASSHVHEPRFHAASWHGESSACGTCLPRRHDARAG